MKMLNDLSLAEERNLCGEEWIFHLDNAAIHKASITKKFDGLIVAKVYEGGRQHSAIS